MIAGLSGDFHFILAGLLLLLQLSAILHVLISKHENPSQAAFWLLLLALLPGAGLVGYVVFGITDIEHAHNVIVRLRGKLSSGKEILSRRLFEQLRSLKDFQLSSSHSHLVRMLMFDRLFPQSIFAFGENLFNNRL